MSLIRLENKKFFNNIGANDITDNKIFWKIIKPLFTEKVQTKSKITLREGKKQIVSEREISEDQVLAEVFNKFFINIGPNLKIPTNYNYDTDFIVTNDQITNTLNKFRNHLSIIMIQSKRKTEQCFFFDPVTYNNIYKKQITLTLLKHFKKYSN